MSSSIKVDRNVVPRMESLEDRIKKKKTQNTQNVKTKEVCNMDGL